MQNCAHTKTKIYKIEQCMTIDTYFNLPNTDLTIYFICSSVMSWYMQNLKKLTWKWFDKY